LNAEIGFDIVHQLNMVGFREPGYLWKLGVPFVWGPIGGMGLFPWRFLPTVGPGGALYYLAYNLANAWQMRFARRPRLAARAAGSALICATAENQRGAQVHWGCDGRLLSEVGLPPPSARARTPTRREVAQPLRIVWTGLHEPRKALNLALEALARLPRHVQWRLDVVGDGPRRKPWQSLSRSLGIEERCIFHGWLSREDALGVMASSHLMLITSLRDLTATVTIEALAAGLPIVCLDHCGFSDAVDETCGIKIPVATPRQVILALAEAIGRLESDETLRLGLAHGAIKRAADFTWEAKADVVDAVYRRQVAAARLPLHASALAPSPD
jgi:glycosyltransferase involved in cell wall biosynthesis